MTRHQPRQTAMTVESQTIELSPKEADLLTECEAVISQNLRAVAETGNALAVIRDSRLYRVSHGTFEDYLADRWQISRPHAYRCIDAAAVLELISSPIGDKPIAALPATESQARPLARLLAADNAPAEIRDAWTEAVETAPRDQEGGPRVTAKHVKEVVDRRVPKPAEPVQRKPARRPLPDAFRDATRELLKAVERVERLTTDTRFARNAPQIAKSCRRDLSCSTDLLAAVVSRVSNPTEESNQ